MATILAPIAARPNTHLALQQFAAARAWLERWLEAERDQLALWLPVTLGVGITGWFLLPGPREWVGALAACLALAGIALAGGIGGRASRVLLVGALAAAAGLALVWWRAERVAAPVLARPALVELTAQTERADVLAARKLVRLTLLPQARRDLPPRIRVNLAEADVPAGLGPGAIIRLRARLMPPAPPSVPGGYDFARIAWFGEFGATGRGFAPVVVVRPGRANSDLRDRLSAHIRATVPGSGGGIASALATGEQGGIEEVDAEAIRRSGLAHLLSVSGLHVTAVVGATMLIVLRLLALSPWAALNLRLPLVAAGAGALAAIGYTLLTGSEVPTVRSCVAALLVLAALAMGREAITLRLVAAGAVFVLLFWPESLAGPSFQLSFAAVTSIIALHEHQAMRRWLGPGNFSWPVRLARGTAVLLLTGIAVEITLTPIAMYHFHRAGLYGAFANIVAIPLTTFVIMPFEAAALVFDAAGLGAPFWWVTKQGLDLLLWIAHTTANAPGAVRAVPSMPDGAFALTAAGGLWLMLLRTPARRFGLVAIAAGVGWAALTPAPDLLVTGDGRHLAVRRADGSIALLRDRAGDYTRQMLSETGGSMAEPLLLSDLPDARCSRDACLMRAGVAKVLAIRSTYRIDWEPLTDACRAVDIVVSERRLPRGCAPRWFKLDRPVLTRTGGVALSGHAVRTVLRTGDRHPWRVPPKVTPIRSSPASFPAAGGASGTAAAGRSGSVS